MQENFVFPHKLSRCLILKDYQKYHSHKKRKDSLETRVVLIEISMLY